MRTTPVLTVPRLLDRCRHFNVQLLAENVETDEELKMCMELGFDLFQGLPLGRPQIVSGQILRPEHHSTLQLAGEVMNPDTDFGRLEQIVRTDPALAYRVVQLASIGRLGEFGRDVRSIREALVAIGINRLRGWLPALILRPDGPAVNSALPTVLARARMAELFAQVTYPEESGFAFTAGMISALDLLLGLPPTEVSAALDIPSDLRAAAFRTDTPMGRLIHDVIAYQQRADASLMGIELDANTVATTSAHAFTWAMNATDLIDQPMAA